jgi:hypothetical protein
MYHISVYQRGAKAAHAVVRASSETGRQLVEGVARRLGYHTKKLYTHNGSPRSRMHIRFEDGPLARRKNGR